MAQLEIAIKALEEIRNTQGKVCEIYEICEHVSCSSSYASWAIADEALRHLTPRALDDADWWDCDCGIANNPSWQACQFCGYPRRQ